MQYPIATVRFIAVSATIPNASDLAEWLQAPPQGGVRVFGEELRPVRLTTLVRGYQKTGNEFFFDQKLTCNVWSILAENSRGKPALVFCPSRKGVAAAASKIAQEAVSAAKDGRPSVLIRDPAHHARLQAAAGAFASVELRNCIAVGVGMHHAAMEPSDRASVEALFRAQELLVLCATSTLAVGVNLPAYLVVIKGTRRYAGAQGAGPSGYQEYDRATVLQMIGRAGRPQFDTAGCAVIMTDRESQNTYEQLVHASEPVESTLHSMMPEYLNAEIALGTITDVPSAIEWLRSTFFYVRVRRNPAAYHVPANLHHNGPALEAWLRDSMVLATAKQLSTHGLIKMEDNPTNSLRALEPGIIMAEHYVKLPTMVEVSKCAVKAGIPQLMWVIARSGELAEVKLRRNEKKALNAVNKSNTLKYHVMSPTRPDRVVDRISTPADKIFILVSTYSDDCRNLRTYIRPQPCGIYCR